MSVFRVVIWTAVSKVNKNYIVEYYKNISCVCG